MLNLRHSFLASAYLSVTQHVPERVSEVLLTCLCFAPPALPASHLSFSALGGIYYWDLTSFLTAFYLSVRCAICMILGKQGTSTWSWRAWRIPGPPPSWFAMVSPGPGLCRAGTAQSSL